jgi:hypothetical protein
LFYYLKKQHGISSRKIQLQYDDKKKVGKNLTLIKLNENLAMCYFGPLSFWSKIKAFVDKGKLPTHVKNLQGFRPKLHKVTSFGPK